MVACQRTLFDVPEDIACFDCAALAPILTASRDAGLVGVERKVQPWRVRSPQRIAKPDRIRALFAGLIGASAQDIAIIPAASYGIATAAINLPVKAGERIVVLQDQYPNNVLPWIMKRAREGAELVFVARPADDDLTTGILEAIDERTAIAALPHCFWADGTLIDLAAVGQRCREVGAALVVDGNDDCRTPHEENKRDLLPARHVDRLIDQRISWYRDALARINEFDGSDQSSGAYFVQGFGGAVYKAALDYLEANKHVLIAESLRAEKDVA